MPHQHRPDRRAAAGPTRALSLALVLALTLAAEVAAADPSSAVPFVAHAAAVAVSGAATVGGPLVAMDAGDRILVVWAETAAPDAEPTWRARIYDTAGSPLSAPLVLTGPGADQPLVGGVSDLAMAPDGRWAIASTDGESVFLSHFTPAGEPEGPAVRVDLGHVPAHTELLGVERPALALAADGSGLLLWVQRLSADDLGPSFVVQRLVGRRFDAAGQPVGDEVERAVWVAEGFAFHGTYDAAFNAAGTALVATVRQTGDPAVTRLAVTLLAPDGGEVPLDAGDAAVLHPSEENPHVAADGSGSFAVAFDDTSGQGPDSADGSCSSAWVRFYAADGTPLAPERRVHRETLGCQGLVGLAGLAGGGWLVAWIGASADPALGVDGSREGIWLTTYDGDGKEVGAPVRILPTSGDFRTLPVLAAGDGRAVLAEPRNGLRLHLLAAAGAAACPPPAAAGPLCLGAGRWRIDAHWRDPYNGGPLGDASPRPLVADTGALWFFHPGNLELLVKVLDGRPVDGHWWVFYGAVSTVEYWLDVTDLALGRQASYWNPPFVQASRADTAAFEGEVAAPARATAAAHPPAPAEESSPSCAPGPTRLCIHQRFAVEVSWRDPRSGDAGDGHAVPIDGSSGAFWFFDEANLELLVKVLDGRTVNGHWWVFHGGLSDVEYTLTVTDTRDGTPVTYRNPPFQLTGGADTAAFPDAP